MPLSEHEQRILRQIEQELAADPTFADRATRIPRRRMTMLTISLFAGLGLVVAGLAVSFWLAFAAFVGVLVVGAALEQELRLMTRSKFGSLPINAWLTGGVRNARRRRPD
jgi:hypothetical protein